MLIQPDGHYTCKRDLIISGCNLEQREYLENMPNTLLLQSKMSSFCTGVFETASDKSKN